MESNIHPRDFRVPAGTKVKLKRWPTLVDPIYDSKKEYAKLLQKQVEELSALQKLHYASNRYAVLLIFQAMDAAGKDGAIRHVMSGVNPQGCQVFSFKQPSATELEHDFLWRSTRELPERGRIGIFNRSYYEDVLIVRVHPEILQSQRLPEHLLDEKASGRGATNRSWTSKVICTATERASSSSSCICRRTNNGSASWNASTIQTRTGSSASATSKSDNIGSSTARRTRRA